MPAREWGAVWKVCFHDGGDRRDRQRIPSSRGHVKLDGGLPGEVALQTLRRGAAVSKVTEAGPPNCSHAGHRASLLLRRHRGDRRCTEQLGVPVACTPPPNYIQ